MKKFMYEILNEINSTDSKNEKKRIMMENATPWFKQMLVYAYDPRIEFYVKDFPKDYIEPNDTAPGISFSDIQSELKRVYMFIKGNEIADKLSEEKRNVLLNQVLESFEPTEAKVFVNMLKKDLKTKGLTYNLINEVFPGLLPEKNEQ
jgi:hypothetical protein